ncbi:hypothetical protein chiPu_0000226 [Chiloscyllium punctatum]|uniref:Uncharacterized protein n=1 Tax=Chiloscyllium punctatum TaxID=137246 RepID=A0A401RUQ0_CHIPU|nr:hypothetical protein [Chiloscyllium punctatum]
MIDSAVAATSIKRQSVYSEQEGGSEERNSANMPGRPESAGGRALPGADRVRDQRAAAAIAAPRSRRWPFADVQLCAQSASSGPKSRVPALARGSCDCQRALLTALKCIFLRVVVDHG